MARAIWKGTLSFGLVEIPVGLVAAERANETKLVYLDRRDFSPVGYTRYNKVTEEEVPWSEIVRGFEHEKGEYVVLTDADLESANPSLTQTVQILHFVDGAEIEPIYFDKPYYLEPLQAKSRGYVLLRETLRHTNRVGIARVAIRTREHIAAVGVRDDVLALYLLRFAHEVRPPSEIEKADVSLKDVRVQPKELAMAEQLVAGMVEEWDPESYTDEYADDLLALVERKVRSGDIHALTPDEKEPGRKRGKVIDLMPLLEKSLAAARKGERPTRPRSKRTTTHVAAKRAASSAKKRSTRKSA